MLKNTYSKWSTGDTSVIAWTRFGVKRASWFLFRLMQSLYEVAASKLPSNHQRQHHLWRLSSFWTSQVYEHNNCAKCQLIPSRKFNGSRPVLGVASSCLDALWVSFCCLSSSILATVISYIWFLFDNNRCTTVECDSGTFQYLNMVE